MLFRSDVMMSNTIYKKAGSSEDAIAEIKVGAGNQFDPDMVNAFVKVINNGAKA